MSYALAVKGDERSRQGKIDDWLTKDNFVLVNNSKRKEEKTVVANMAPTFKKETVVKHANMAPTLIKENVVMNKSTAKATPTPRKRTRSADQVRSAPGSPNRPIKRRERNLSLSSNEELEARLEDRRDGAPTPPKLEDGDLVLPDSPNILVIDEDEDPGVNRLQ